MATTGSVALGAQIKPLYPNQPKRGGKKKPPAKGKKERKA